MSDTPARAIDSPKLIKALRAVPRELCRFRLRRLDKHSLTLHTIGTYSQEADAQADRQWWEKEDWGGTFVVTN